MTSELMEQVMTPGTAASAKALGFKLPAARQNRNDERLQGRVVRRLHQRDDLRRLGRLRPADHHRRRGYGPALALPVWTSDDEAAQRFPARLQST